MARKAQPVADSKHRPAAKDNTRKKKPLGGAFARVAAASADTGDASAREALRLSRAGLNYLEASKSMGCSISTYYEALKRGRALARAELVAEAVDFQLELTEGHRRTIARAEADAEAARGEGDVRAAAACERVASQARDALAKLWGANAPERVEVTGAADPIAAALAQVAGNGDG